jgi:hypothetical protein
MRVFAVVFTGGMILACAGGRDKDENQDSSPGLPEDNVDQAAICADYLNCLAAVDPSALASVQSTYGTNGTCWTDEATAEQCAEACKTGLAQMDDEYPEEPKCDDGEVTEASELEGQWTFEAASSDGGCDDFILDFNSMDLEISANGSKDFTANGQAEVGIFGNPYDFNLEFDCSLSEDDFSCDEYVGKLDSHWNLEGVYRETGIEATLELGLGDAEGGIQCTEVITLNGEAL